MEGPHHLCTNHATTAPKRPTRDRARTLASLTPTPRRSQRRTGTVAASTNPRELPPTGDRIPQEIGLLLLYNVAFVVPLLAVIAVMLLAGRRADPWLQKGGAWRERRGLVVLASLLLFVGSVLAVLGGSGLVKQ